MCYLCLIGLFSIILTWFARIRYAIGTSDLVKDLGQPSNKALIIYHVGAATTLLYHVNEHKNIAYVYLAYTT